MLNYYLSNEYRLQSSCDKSALTNDMLVVKRAIHILLLLNLVGIKHSFGNALLSIVKLSASSGSDWAELALFSINPTTHLPHSVHKHL